MNQIYAFCFDNSLEYILLYKNTLDIIKHQINVTDNRSNISKIIEEFKNLILLNTDYQDWKFFGYHNHEYDKNNYFKNSFFVLKKEINFYHINNNHFILKKISDIQKKDMSDETYFLIFYIQYFLKHPKEFLVQY